MKKLKKLFPQKYKNVYHLVFAVFWVLFYRYPAGKLKVIGVTGTDGKTTTSTIIYHILKSLGKKVALISTVAAYVGDKELDVGLHVTSPNPRLLQKLLKEIIDEGYEYLVLEVTSHGLDQHRLFGIDFEIGVLTNISHEHLDYHKTYKNYVKAKSMLFNKSKLAILNKDDKSFREIKKYIDSRVKVRTYHKSSLSVDLKRVVDKRFSENYNKANATAAISSVKGIGIKEKDIIGTIDSFPGVTGRLEEIKNKKGINIYIDFAHTPNSLENILRELKIRTKRSLITVFGCAGERDYEKREKMGMISTKYADISVFSAEDPRSEDVNNIIDQMIKGAKKNNIKEISRAHYSCTPEPFGTGQAVNGNDSNYYSSVPDRGEAITFAINKLAKKGDTVVICGKGHEKSMCYDGVEYPWSDHEAVKFALKGKVMHTKRT
jgi:UDP-N-acetylmuramoyl-L-alanyl-D-glutamate--2,6-diaminopimelate ligase